MPIPSRSRSLRQPGYSHRELLENTKQSTGSTNHGVNDGEIRGVELERGNTSADEVTESVNNGPVSLATERRLGEVRNLQSDGARLSTRSSTHGSLQGQGDFGSGCRLSLQTAQRGGIRPSSGVSENVGSKRMPPPSQLSRSSSLRQPTSVSGDCESTKGLHSRNASVAGTSTISRLRSGSTAARPQAQEDRRAIAQSLPLPVPASTVAKTAVASRQNPSIASVRESGSKKPIQDRLTPAARPQFSTYQQHFSPKKHSAAEPTKISLNSPYSIPDIDQVSMLQDELLQLQWMYHFSHQRLQTWIEGRETTINQQRKKHLQEDRHVKKAEQNQQKRINAAALRDWLVVGKGQMSVEKVESLARHVRTLTDIAQSHAKLSQVVGQFKEWCREISDTLRERSEEGQVKSPKFLQSLGTTWTDTVTMLIHSVHSCLQHLQELGLGDTLSGLGLVLDGHIRFAQGVLDELCVMEDIHAMVLAHEEVWINSKITALLSAESESVSSPCGSRHYAAWEDFT